MQAHAAANECATQRWKRLARWCIYQAHSTCTLSCKGYNMARGICRIEGGLYLHTINKVPLLTQAHMCIHTHTRTYGHKTTHVNMSHAFRQNSYTHTQAHTHTHTHGRKHTWHLPQSLIVGRW